MLNVYEIIEEFEEVPVDDEERIEVIRKYAQNSNFTNWLQGIFHPGIHFVEIDDSGFKPDDVPPGMSYSSFGQEFKRIYLFVKNHPRCPEGLTDKRRKEILLQILEGLEPKEADMWMRMLRKEAGVDHLTKDLVEKALPELNLEN
jgi:hypothetical protein